MAMSHSVGEDVGSEGLAPPLNPPSSEGEDEDAPKLSSYAMAALQEFYLDQQSALQSGDNPVITEDWVMLTCLFNKVDHTHCIHPRGGEGCR